MSHTELLVLYVSNCRSEISIKQRQDPDLVITRQLLDKVAKRVVRRLDPQGESGINADDIVRELMNIYTIWVGWEGALTDVKHEAWLSDERIQKTNWQYWDRYRQFLLESGMSEASVNSHEKNTLEVLGDLEPPEKPGRWETRGMVVGYVQSGKTGNYAGLICRAIDIGYKVIVILAGMHNSLRSQTQERIDESVLGYDSTHNLDNRVHLPIGVGLIDNCEYPVGTITTSADDGDFKSSVARHFNIFPGGHPLVFVIKKNGLILKNMLEDWVTEIASMGRRTNEGYPIVKDIPMLVIDDEADFGSIDTRRQVRLPNGQIDEEHDPTVINERIRKLLYGFEKSAYVGYTATPFASILIHPQNELPGLGKDLFPENFIRCLPVPSNYIGPLQVFGIRGDQGLQIEAVSGLPLVREADDAIEWMPPRHKKHHQPRFDDRDAIPNSLGKAIMSFLLSCAVRLARGQINTHNSMLIHVTRFTNMQNRVAVQVQEFLDGVVSRVLNGDGDRKPTIYEEFKELYVCDYIPTSREISADDCDEVSWKDVKPMIQSVLDSLKPVRRINGTSDDILDYRQNKDYGLTLIVVGGEKLSRGLTLEGLSVSYFLRNSRMYDTLMQMGRWFGYRPGYKDVCRIFLPKRLKDDFADITFANEEVLGDFAEMMAMNKTPLEFGLRVRSHPSLLVTSPTKMRAGSRVQISYAGDISETIVFYKSDEIIRYNQTVVMRLLKTISKRTKPDKNPSLSFADGRKIRWHGLCWRNIKANNIIRFLREYRTHHNNRRVNSDLIAKYIWKMTSEHSECLKNWTVFMPAGSEKKRRSFHLPKPLDLNHKMIERACLCEGGDDATQSRGEDYRIRRLLNPPDEAVDLTEIQWLLALKLTELYWSENPRKNRVKEIPDIPSGNMIRKARDESNGLLLIYPLEPDAEKAEKGVKSPPIFGFGISFPESSRDEKVEYVVSPLYDFQDNGDDI